MSATLEERVARLEAPKRDVAYYEGVIVDYTKAMEDLIDVATLCTDQGMNLAAKYIAFRAHQLPREGLIATRDRLGLLVEISLGEERAAYQMAYDAPQRIITRGIGVVT